MDLAPRTVYWRNGGCPVENVRVVAGRVDEGKERQERYGAGSVG